MKKDNTLFLYTRSIHNSPNLQNELDYKANINKDYVQFDYKYFVVKYKPLTKTEG